MLNSMIFKISLDSQSRIRSKEEASQGLESPKDRAQLWVHWVFSGY